MGVFDVLYAIGLKLVEIQALGKIDPPAVFLCLQKYFLEKIFFFQKRGMRSIRELLKDKDTKYKVGYTLTNKKDPKKGPHMKRIQIDKSSDIANNLFYDGVKLWKVK